MASAPGNLVNHHERVQCTHPGCQFVAPRSSNPTRCIFHGEVEFTDDVTSTFLLSLHGRVFKPIPGGHISLYVDALTGDFGGVVVSHPKCKELIRSLDLRNVPSAIRPYIREVFKMVRHTAPTPTRATLNPDVVRCEVCGHEAPTLLGHIQQEHEMTKDEYRTLHPGAMLICKSLLLKFAKEAGKK